MKCPICIDKVTPDSFYVTRCGHVFHYKCLEEWFQIKNTCPYCRQIQYHRRKPDLSRIFIRRRRYPNFRPHIYIYMTGGDPGRPRCPPAARTTGGLP